MSVIKIKVDDQQIALTNMPVIASGGVEENQVEFEFSSDWAGFACVACFYRDDKAYTSLVSATGVADVPYEVTAKDGKMWLGVMGVKDGVTKTSELAFYKILQGAITKDFDPGEPTPDIYNQILDYVSGVVDLEQRLIVVENKSSTNADNIATQTARIDNMINSQTNESVTTLWTGSLQTKNQSVTLSEDISNFDFVDIYCGGADSIFARKPVASSIEFELQEQNMSDDASGQFLRWWETALRISGTTATIIKCVKCFWDDFSQVPVVSQATDGVQIIRIDGVKIGHIEDDEITDARVGADGVTYNTLGTAIRTQFTNAKNDINNKVNNLRDDLEIYLTQDLIPDGLIKPSDGTVGSPALGWRYTDYIEVIPDSKVYVHAVFATTSGGIAVYDEDKNFLFSKLGSVISVTDYSTTEVIIPSNGKYIRTSCYDYHIDLTQFYVGYDLSLLKNYNRILELNEIKVSKQSGKNKFTCGNRKRGNLQGSAPSNKRMFFENEYYVGLSVDGYYEPGNVTEYSVSDNDVVVKSRNGYALAFPILCEPNTRYMLSCISSDDDLSHLVKAVSFYDVNGSNISYASGLTSFVTPSNAHWLVVHLGSTRSAPNAVQFTNIQVEYGSAPTAYEAYKTVNALSQFIGVPYAGNTLIVDENGYVIPSSNLEVDTIISRNKDVLLNAQASCFYGVHSGGVINAKKKLSILVTTDVHGFENGMISAVKYLNDMPFVELGVCLGDKTPAYYSDSNGVLYTDAVNEATKRFYTILGNHDSGNGKLASQCSTVAQAFAKWIQPTLNTMDKTGLTTPYYHVQNDTYKTTMVFLNSYDVPDATDGSGNFVVSRGTEVISQTQINWLLDVLDNVPSDYTLVLFAHSFPYSNVSQTCNWTQADSNLVGNSVACYTNIIPDIINAWKNGESLVKTYAPNIPEISDSVSINHSFASRGTGLFACYVVGHGHKDVIAHSETYPDQLAIGLCATALDTWQNGNTDLPRMVGEKSEDAITLLSVDPNSKRINLVRIGSNITTRMVDRTMISVEYS